MITGAITVVTTTMITGCKMAVDTTAAEDLTAIMATGVATTASQRRGTTIQAIVKVAMRLW